MERCPRCGDWTVDYDNYKKVRKCYKTGCSCYVYNDGSYSYLRQDRDKIQRVRKFPNGETKVEKEYNYH